MGEELCCDLHSGQFSEIIHYRIHCITHLIDEAEVLDCVSLLIDLMKFLPLMSIFIFIYEENNLICNVTKTSSSVKFIVNKHFQSSTTKESSVCNRVRYGYWNYISQSLDFDNSLERFSKTGKVTENQKMKIIQIFKFCWKTKKH